MSKTSKPEKGSWEQAKKGKRIVNRGQAYEYAEHGDYIFFQSKGYGIHSFKHSDKNIPQTGWELG